MSLCHITGFFIIIKIRILVQSAMSLCHSVCGLVVSCQLSVRERRYRKKEDSRIAGSTFQQSTIVIVYKRSNSMSMHCVTLICLDSSCLVACGWMIRQNQSFVGPDVHGVRSRY